MLLAQLFSPWISVSLDLDLEITGISMDSRAISVGNLFIALPGTKVNGSDYITQAIKRGAIALLIEGNESSIQIDNNTQVCTIVLPDLKNLYGLIAARFYDYPSRHIKVIGITGTNGKTSCAHYLGTLLNSVNKPSAIMGSLGYGLQGNLKKSINNTADAITNQAFLSEMLKLHVEYVVMEVSSHGLDQGRVNGIEFYAAIYTNLTQDHLDYHHTLEAYAETKRKLFMDFNPAISVFNVDDPIVQKTMKEVAEVKDTKVCTYGFNSPPEEGGQPQADGVVDLKAKILSYTKSGMKAALYLPSGVQEVDIPLIGDFNLSNLLAVLSLLFAMDVDAMDKLHLLRPVQGRMQLLTATDRPNVIIDYAHTPDALEKVLKTLSLYKPAKLWCVFGCGGDRDRAKRPLMGQISSQYADEIIVTDDNCRFEDPVLIAADVAAGILKDKNYQIIHDRRAAIQFALEKATQDDIVLIGGKGHEDYQEIKGERFHFSDEEEVLSSLRGA